MKSKVLRGLLVGSAGVLVLSALFPLTALGQGRLVVIRPTRRVVVYNYRQPYVAYRRSPYYGYRTYGTTYRPYYYNQYSYRSSQPYFANRYTYAWANPTYSYSGARSCGNRRTNLRVVRF
jgi:hypothetical protein